MEKDRGKCPIHTCSSEGFPPSPNLLDGPTVSLLFLEPSAPRELYSWSTKEASIDLRYKLCFSSVHSVGVSSFPAKYCNKEISIIQIWKRRRFRRGNRHAIIKRTQKYEIYHWRSRLFPYRRRIVGAWAIVLSVVTNHLLPIYLVKTRERKISEERREGGGEGEKERRKDKRTIQL